MSEYERMKADYDRMKRNEEARIERAAYERGLRRGMAIARIHSDDRAAMGLATEQMEREIEEAKR